MADFADMTTLDYEKPFIVYYDNVPVGYIQCYFCSKVGNGWWENYDDDIAGIDYILPIDLEFTLNSFSDKSI